ncbi:hypothetical protein AN639_00830 [Candidatus Epulonipiscium fishelsonii]|uniref:Uncharacterized protein n=1 Tax=Candidatus Epulonipiscium fishelsonii TaxID=77094 RepID=A0ACC8X7G4_9FIRM|nr:hypothetical protein AN396_12325 [Epulopiscium sp. SCG-B11WGA-EpuloA1]ONI41342.1 hypothetical protein AN639_00830 [Epulopiscium sp. SCG-B05WGA-EpuloA1]
MLKIMKKLMLSLCTIAALSVSPKVQAIDSMRGIWISTVYNLDFPKTNNPDLQKQEFETYLNKLREIGINTVIVQIRPTADAFYDSKINPWSKFLTGSQGQHPGYDPLEFMIEETHKRGMEFHAWLNPYRVTTEGTNLNDLSPDHPARKNPNWTISHNNALFYNPELEAVKVHIEETVQEIVKNYNVDAIHFDDYFYPPNYPLPAGELKDGMVADKRREHINDMVKRVHDIIMETNPNVKFGISPMGIWKNDFSDLTGSSTTGGESYYTIYADTRTWIKNEWIDYVVPQIYWQIGHKSADYETLVKWWANEVEGTDVDLYIGQGIYRDEVAMEIEKQLAINKEYYKVKGSIFFTMDDLLDNRGGSKDVLQSYYSGYNTESPRLSNMLSNMFNKSNKIENHTDHPILVINGKTITTSQPPILDHGTTLVPIRVISEYLGAKVDWDGNTKSVSIKKDNNHILLTIGKNVAKVNNRTYIMNLAPQLVNDTTMVPIRLISEHLGAEITWHDEEKVVEINF